MEKNYIDVKKERRDRYDKKANKKVSKKAKKNSQKNKEQEQ